MLFESLSISSRISSFLLFIDLRQQSYLLRLKNSAISTDCVDNLKRTLSFNISDSLLYELANRDFFYTLFNDEFSFDELNNYALNNLTSQQESLNAVFVTSILKSSSSSLHREKKENLKKFSYQHLLLAE